MQSIGLVASYTNLVSGHDIPEPDSIRSSNRLEFRVVYRPSSAPCLRDGEEVVKVGRVGVGSGSVNGRPAGKVFEGGRHDSSLDTESCQGLGG